MLMAIPPRAVALGMYVHGFRGGWLSHPFWRAHFLLTDPADVRRIHESSISAVVIDLDRGIGPKAGTPAPPAQHPPLSAARLAEDQRLATAVLTEARNVVKGVFDAARLGRPVHSRDVVGVVESISRSLDRNRSMLLGIIRMKSKDEYTYFHSVSVCTLMINLARELDMEEDLVHQMGLAGLLHDIGKTAIPEAILNKPGPLTEAEFEEIRQHTSRGHALLALGEGVPELALDVCLHHHEKVDGSGYPAGLGDDQISLAARMGAICDVYDALTSVRPYKGAASPSAAIAAMAEWQGHFDPDLLFTFMKSIGLFPTGMLVRMHSGQLAIVRDNGRRASRARLTIFYDIAQQRFLEPHDLFLTDVVEEDIVMAEAYPAEHGFTDWPELRDRLLSGRAPEPRA